MIRYHSFYPAHREGEYACLMNQRDREMFAWVRNFNPFDLYSKSNERPNQKEIRTFLRGAGLRVPSRHAGLVIFCVLATRVGVK